MYSYSSVFWIRAGIHIQILGWIRIRTQILGWIRIQYPLTDTNIHESSTVPVYVYRIH